VPPEITTPLLTVSQRRVVGFALTLLAFLGSVALLIAAFMVLGRLVMFFSNVLWPLAVAGVLALMLRPLVVRVERRFKLRRVFAVVVLYGTFVLAAAAVLVAILPPLIEQAIAFIAFLPALWERVSTYVTENFPDWVAIIQQQLTNPTVRQIAESIATESRTLFSHALPSLRAAFGGMIDLVAFVTHLAIIPVYLFFFLLMRGRPARSLGQQLPFLKPGTRDDVVFLVSEFVAIIEAFFRGQLLIGLSMGALYAVGFTLVGLKFSLFLGLLLGLLNIIPYLGMIIGLLLALPLAFFQPGGGWQLVGLVALVKVVVQLIESWVLTPRIMGHQTGLHPVAIIVAIFFWGTAFGGVLGMLLAVPLTAFFVTAWRLAKRKYFVAQHA
jgi:predicted PurR-regulated permease PerM